MNLYSDVADRVLESFVETSEVIRIWNELDCTRPHNRNGLKKDPPGHLFISGQSRSGKSLMVKKYVEKNSGKTIVTKNGDEIDIKPVIYMQVPHPFTQLGFYKKISEEALMAPRLPGKQSVYDAQDRAFILLEKMQVEMLILDEIDYISNSRAVKPLEAMDTLKYISNNSKVSLVCVGQPEIEKLRKMNLQYFSRFTPIYFGRFVECNYEFCLFLKKLEEQLKIPKYIGLGDMDTELPQIFHKMSKGLIGILTRIIYVAFRNISFLDNITDLDLGLFIKTLRKAQESVIGNIDSEDFSRTLDGQMQLHKSK
jgi:hypothetical protein